MACKLLTFHLVKRNPRIHTVWSAFHQYLSSNEMFALYKKSNPCNWFKKNLIMVILMMIIII